MSSYLIGLTGLRVAQQSLDLVGTNITNATTPGYNRQELQIASLELSRQGKISLGGAEVVAVKRCVDELLQRQILQQTTRLGQADQRTSILQTIESALGGLDSNSLGSAMDQFTSALSELSTDPNSPALRQQVIWSADGMASQFRNLSGFLSDLRRQLFSQVSVLSEQVNSLTQQIAIANGQIGQVLFAGGGGNLIQDNRDQAVAELAELIGVEAQIQPGGTVQNVLAMGTPLVLGSHAVEIESGIGVGNTIGVTIKGAGNLQTDVDGGRIGALLTLANDYIPALQARLDSLAGQLISDINQLHSQGVGTTGGFTQVTGQSVDDGPIAAALNNVSPGSFFIRVTNEATGQVTRHEISVDPQHDSMAGIVARLDALDNITASRFNGAMNITAADGYTFDFLPALSVRPDSSAITGTAEAAVSGLYSGSSNEVYTCTVSGSGQVGATDGLRVVVTNAAGAVVKTLNVGTGYASLDRIEIGQGVFLSMGPGTLNNGDSFTIAALADSDTSGLLAAAGINTFFNGTGAADIAVRQELMNDPRSLALAIGQGAVDGANLQRMIERVSQPHAALDNVAAEEYLQQIVTGVGQDVFTGTATQKSLAQVVGLLADQREGVSGVDVNEEAAKMLMFQRMYQAVSKFIAAQDKALSFLMDVL
ncbi:MAG: flagellar hook-associated protein FlgK [Planctomycetaceae bacterium]|nr:flagellar hook-associated protein FlgK [Planctomycetaceae bacterium]